MNQNQNQNQQKIASVPNAQTTPQVMPQVVNIHQEENKIPPVQTAVEASRKSSKKNNVFLIILILLLFSFVFFLPNITGFITKLKNESANHMPTTSLKSGKMRCYITKDMNDIDYSITHEFTYDKNKLKTEQIVTVYQLKQASSNTSLLLEKQSVCENLEAAIDEFDGMSAFCVLKEKEQETTQEINYRTIKLSEVNKNIAEFEGFYPSFKLDQNIDEVKRNMEQSLYTCTMGEK